MTATIKLTQEQYHHLFVFKYLKETHEATTFEHWLELYHKCTLHPGLPYTPAHLHFHNDEDAVIFRLTQM